jgi:KTSC domain
MAPSQWIEIDSSAIERYRFASAGDEISVVFRGNPKIYHYPCTPALRQAFLDAPSKGAFVQKVLKPLSPTGV